MDDAIVTVTQTRDDEHDRTGRLVSRHNGVHLTVENTMSLRPDGSLLKADLHLTADDAEWLSLVLAEFAARARRAAVGAHRHEVQVPEARKADQVGGVVRPAVEFGTAQVGR
ncbi:hypothetical protein ACQPZA_20600 [Pseudonocardia xinjiangensis]|uniref:hypothetical protein n=1 Tax=Pseudonocardia xinjiangensis TaxID=75289 RepID=UPI003D8F05C3